MGYLDTALDAAKVQLRQAMGAVAGLAGHRQASQSLTIGCPEETVRAMFGDPERLSEVLGDIAEVQRTADGDRFRWVFRSGPLDGTSWESKVVTNNGRLCFVDAGDETSGNELVLDFAEAPRGRGTEVTLRVSTPAPGLLSGALAYKALYRARALLQTGEIPTIRHNPSARTSAR